MTATPSSSDDPRTVALEHALRALESADASERCQGARDLGEPAAIQALPPLLYALADKDAAVAAAAAEALAALGDSRALPSLALVATAEVPSSVRAAASAAIQALRAGESSGSSIAADETAAILAREIEAEVQRALELPAAEPGMASDDEGAADATKRLRERPVRPGDSWTDELPTGDLAAATRAIRRRPTVGARLPNANPVRFKKRGEPSAAGDAGPTADADLLHAAAIDVDAPVLSTPDGFDLTLAVGRRSQRVTVVFSVKDANQEPIVLVQSVGGRATETNYRWALRLSLRLLRGKVAIRRIDGTEMFVFCRTLDRDGLDAARLAAAIRDAADRGDWIERQLHGHRDRH